VHRVLIIDDTQAIHDDFEKILSPDAGLVAGSTSFDGAKVALFGAAPAPVILRSFDVQHALKGEDGWRQITAAVADAKPFSVAFVDMRMPPGWDGLDTIQHLWQADPELQVVICTAYSDHSWEEITTRLGLTDRLLILKKPFDPVEVVQLATALSEKWALKRQASLKFDELETLVHLRTHALEHAATHDRLTGLSNRAMLTDRLTRMIERNAASPGTAHAVLFLDFDRFKVINDSLDHDAGDKMLVEISRRLSASLASDAPAAQCTETLAARMGGDEFVVLLDGLASPQDAAAVAQKLLERLAEPYPLKGYNLTASASIGITTSQIGYATTSDALRDADTAMYHAKATGKARFVVFDRSMHAAAKDRLALEHDLRGAVERNEMLLHYQPVVGLSDGAILGFEALVRWDHPTRGRVQPDKFIPCAEETRLIVPLGTWVLLTACRQLGEWQRRHPLRTDLVMSVNVSARQLISTQLIDQVRAAVESSGINPSSLALEITESAVIADPDATIDLLRRIKKLGVRIYLDDFGIGYTSLSYLHKLPLNGLKMDRSFMQCVSERRDYAAVVQAIITLSRNLGISVIAEGVETPEQVAMLQAMECEYAQGYLFGRPCEAAQAEKFILRPTLSLAA
jgi:diguanylate cyclase (GGDEF)-like protein